jgi:hypothetical protein
MILLKFFYAVGTLAIACASLFGWGILIRRFSRVPKGSTPVTIALGLSAILVVGGLLNLARIAFAPALWLVAGTGLVACAVHIIPALSRIRPSSLTDETSWSGWSEDALASGFIAIMIGFTVATQLPPAAFNFHDDLQKYFAHPVRMLATGTLFGSPLSALGSETLGGQALLHAMVLSFFPIGFINGADAVFGLLLVMILGADAGRRRLAPLPGAFFAPLLIAIVNPQYVNVSALYLGAALIAASVLLTSDEREPDPPPVIGLGLIYGGLIALKPLFVLFVVLHLTTISIVFMIRNNSLKPMLWATRVALMTGLTVAPWLLLYLPYYANFSSGADFSAAVISVPLADNNFDAFSTQPIFYGATAANYTALVGLALLGGLWGLIGWQRSHSPVSVRNCSGIVGAAATAFGCYAVLLFGPSSLLAGKLTNLRYSIPFLLGIVPSITVLAASQVSFKRPGIGVAVPVLALLIVSIGFVPSAIDRAHQAISYGSILAFTRFATSKPYLEYNHAALSSSAERRVRRLQAVIPAGEPFIAWIDQPFHLNFARNPVIDAEPAGLATSWARVPPGTSFVLWEYQGFAVRSAQDYLRAVPSERDRRINARALGFAQTLLAELKKGEPVYRDDRFVVFRRPAF